jgi:decaprenyl-diphosphate synthase subunit 2
LHRNSEIQELISTVVRDLAESNFIGERDEQNNPLPSDPLQKIHIENPTPIENFDDITSIDMSEILGYSEREWTFRHTLGSGSLLGKSCQGTLNLSGHPEKTQRLGYLFGKHLALAWEANKDLEPFQLFFLPYGKKFSLISAPILFHLEYDPSLYDEIRKGLISIDNVDFQKIHQIVAEGPGVEKTKELQTKHANIALDVLNHFPPCDAKLALEKIISSLLTV